MLILDMAVAKAQWDHATMLLIQDYARCIDRAYHGWDLDHEAQAIDVNKRLQRDCKKTVHTLGGTKQGAELLISFWQGLGEALQSNGDWDEPQRRLCYDLLGIRPELRCGSKQVPPSGDTAGMAALVARQIQILRDRIEDRLDQADLAEQAAAASGFLLHEDAVTKKYRRCAAEHRCDYYKALGLLLRGRAEAGSAGADVPDAGLFPPYPPDPSGAGFDFLFARYQAIAQAELDRLATQHDGDADDGDDQAEPATDAPPGRAPAADAPAAERKPAPRQQPEPEVKPATVDDPAATATCSSAEAEPAPRPLSRRARKERERRLRAQAQAAKRAAQKARSGR
jgi:hypothetical protein